MLDTLNKIIAEMREHLAQSATASRSRVTFSISNAQLTEWADRLSALRGEAVAYCPDCQSAGMRNCSDFVNCGNARCVTCKQLLDAPPAPVVSAELRKLMSRTDSHITDSTQSVTFGIDHWQTIRAFLRDSGVE